jgi:hypothetical protein
LTFTDTVTAAVELAGDRLAVTVGRDTWIGSLGLRDLASQACDVLRPLDSILGVPQDALLQVHEDCKTVGRK